MNIFYTASVRAGRAHQPDYLETVRLLKQYGTVSSEHVSDESLTDVGETDITGRDIFIREQAALESADVVVADVSQPSLGVGFLLGRATALGKRVIALYNGDEHRLSAIIKGHPRIDIHYYTSMSDLADLIENIFTS